jgi:hypothetical protein
MTDANHTAKKCSKCNNTLEHSMFHKSKSSKDGLYCWCKPCYSAYIKIKRSEPDESEKIKTKQAEWYSKNRERVIKQQTDYANKNKNKVAEYRKSWRRNKMSNDDLYRFSVITRCLISNSIRRRGFTKRSKSWVILGCTWKEFHLHIERQFQPGMTWENRSLWHIDHRIPLATAESEHDIIRLNHFTNLQPLWAEDNLRKGAKLEFSL